MVNPDKCVLGVPELNFLGHRVDKHGVRPLEEKVDIIRQFPPPTSQRQLCRFLGLVNFYHRFVLGCAHILQPLHRLLAKSSQGNQHLTWNSEAEIAFTQVKDALADATLLVHPQAKAPTCLITDTLDNAVGAVLQQQIHSVWSPLAYFSRKLSPTRTRYCTFDHELLAVYLAIRHFRHFLEGRQFFVVTDHKPLTLAIISSFKHHSLRQIRHLDFITQFTTDIWFLKGSSNVAADALSHLVMDAIHTGDRQTIDLSAMRGPKVAGRPGFLAPVVCGAPTHCGYHLAV